MKSIKVLISLLCLSYLSLYAMEERKRKLEEPEIPTKKRRVEEVKVKEEQIKLTDKDEKSIIIIPRKIAVMSPTIQNILEDPQLEIGTPIPIPIAQEHTLSAIIVILTEIDKKVVKRSEHTGIADIKNKEAFDTYNNGYIAKEIQQIVQEYLKSWYKAKNYTEEQKEAFTAQLIRLASYLDLPYLINAFAHSFVYANENTYKEILKQPLEKKPEMIKKIADTYEIGSTEIELVKKHFGLREFGVMNELSIADDIAEHGQPKILNNEMSFQDVGLTSFEGIEFIENKESITNFDLSKNYFIEIPAKIFQEFINLKLLKLDENKLNEISAQALQGLTKLHFLSIDVNNLTQLPEELFKGLNIVTLYLNQNKLTEIPTKALQNLNNLAILGLEGNVIANISMQDFQGLNNVRELFLSSNKLIVIPAQAFKNLPKLEELNLSDNQLTEIHDQAFEGLAQLEDLNLKNNKLSKFDPEKLLKGLTNLETLNLKNNLLSKETLAEIQKYFESKGF